MTSYVEFDIEPDWGFDIEKLTEQLLDAVMDYENCPYEALINVIITDSEQTREYNRDYRGIDKTTDVLSFPAVDFETPGDFSLVEEQVLSYFEPDSGELVLGDIIINIDRVISQAEEYGHSIKREFAFLVTHSLFHLCGYDHISGDEAQIMEKRQGEVLDKLGITRDD